MLTLWDLIRPVVSRVARPTRTKPPEGAARPPRVKPRATPMQDLYDRVSRDMLARYHVRVRRWRRSMSGIAWQVRYADGTVARLIESPRPRGPVSVAVFLHEIGHHAIGFDTYSPRCLEEYHAWMFAVAEMQRHGLNITDAVRKRMHDSLRYAVDKARRRGLKRLPPELAPYVSHPSRAAG